MPSFKPPPELPSSDNERNKEIKILKKKAIIFDCMNCHKRFNPRNMQQRYCSNECKELIE